MIQCITNFLDHTKAIVFSRCKTENKFFIRSVYPQYMYVHIWMKHFFLSF